MAPGHNTIASPRPGFGTPKPKPAARPPVPRVPFLDPYAQAEASLLPGFESGAQALEQALMGQAGYEVGRVRNRQGWQQQQLAPFAQSERDVFAGQSRAVSGLGNALAAATRLLGSNLQSDIGQKLAATQAPEQAQQAFAESQGQTGEGAAGAISGLSSAEVARLNSLGGAYGDFSAGLGRIAGLAGDASARDIVQQAANQYALEMAQRQAALQGDISDLAYKMQQDEYERAQDERAFAFKVSQEAYDRRKDALARKDKKTQAAEMMAYRYASLDQRGKIALLSDRRAAQRIWQAERRLGLAAQHEKFGQWYARQRLAVSQQNANTSALNASQPVIKGSPSTGVTVYDPNTGDPLATYPGTNTTSGVPDTVTAKAADWAKKAFWHGVKVKGEPHFDSKGNLVTPAVKSTIHQPMTYGNALNYVLSHLDKGTPRWVAEQALARWYKPGKYGRPKGSAVPSGGSSLGTAAVRAAALQIGQPYVWGGESRSEGGFDCSGLVDWAYRQVGVDFPGRLTTYSAMHVGHSVRGQNLQPGDLVISNGGKHMTMYIGGGKVISAPHKGERVQYQPISYLGPIVDVRRI